MRLFKKLLKIALVALALFLVGCAVYLAYLTITVGLPMAIKLFFVFLK